MITISIQYFAILREQRGATREQLTTAATTPETLYQELRAKYNFTLPAERIRAAVNGEFVTATTSLREGDEIVFIPPVAGG
jgi:molybdopterin converting factor subunit 1